MPVVQVPDDIIWFPASDQAEEDGLLAFGGDLSPRRLLVAYMNGIFPWYNPGEEILWWCPRERFVIFPNEIAVSKSMNKFLKKGTFDIFINRNFRETMHECRQLREGNTWISDEMEQAYYKLHLLGYATSVECYRQGQLVGGLYGVTIGKCFFGESMFSKVANASKTALIILARKLSRDGFVFIDCQFHTKHLEQMGGRYISWETYQELLQQGLHTHQ
jgi:leucyl/phenylalanyl-tRNA--protein transferase